MSECSVVFVILHYLTINDTVDEVSSIKHIAGNYNVKIIIVDNGSNNETGEKLEKIYESDEQIKVILSHSNLGFARGNNLGIEYAMHNYRPDFIVVANNDVLFQQSDFIELVYREYDESRFSVLGPMIITADGMKNSSPTRCVSITREFIVNTLKKEKRLYFFEKFNLYGLFVVVSRIYGRLRSLHKTGNKGNEEKNLWDERQENAVLHGCCLIFSPNFFEHFDGFYPETFLYHEEEILYVQIVNAGLKMVYNPDISVFHKEDSASNEMLPVEHDRRLFKLKNCIKSSRLLLEVYDENNGG